MSNTASLFHRTFDLSNQMNENDMDIVTLGALVATFAVIVAVYAVVVHELRTIDTQRHS